MANLTPEKRLDKHGRLVTRHVKTDAKSSSTALSNIPAPSLGKKNASKVPAPKTVRKHHTGVESRYADERLKAVYRPGIFHFMCSDAEAYDVMSVCDSSHTALRLLGAGVRTKEDAIEFLTKHDMPDLNQDSSEDVEEAIRRGLPAIPALLAFNKYGSTKEHWPDTYFDAIETHTIRTLRGASDSPDRFSHLVLTERISLSDIRVIGATRLAEASRKIHYVEDQLEAINKGKSDYDIDTLKELIMKSESSYYHDDTIIMAKTYGADFVLGLQDLSGAENLIYKLSNKEYDVEQRKEVIKLHDDLVKLRKHLNPQGVALLHEAGVTAQEASDGLDNGMELSAIAAVKQGVAPSVSSGWL